MNSRYPHLSDRDILQARPAKHAVDPQRPSAFLIEQECAASGEVVDVATVFLTNRECVFRCLMCDLWKNTTDHSVPPGAIPRQIDYALERVPPARHLKLYNSGNFFDPRAIPRSDFPAIAQQAHAFENVVVENHPRLCGDECLRFQELLGDTSLEIALGLETVHPDVLPVLNKRMTVADYARAVDFLLKRGIAVRSFILLRPPFLTEEEGVEWALRSVEYAFSLGVGCCAVIPTRTGNGVMERLEADGRFAPPTLSSLERVIEEGLRMKRGRIFVDLWDVERFASCTHCIERRRIRLHEMNLSQRILPPVSCSCGEKQAWRRS